MSRHAAHETTVVWESLPRSVETRAGVLYVNPGSAGPRRFTLPISVGELLVRADGAVSARTFELPAGAA